tara:strand:- start:929 stop:1666 length:738 start_codon:yes stop_codon:yes gene_type:complete
MPKYKITIEYDGTDFVGWQKQKNGFSIQEALQNAIKKLSSENSKLFGAGRTDSGVHAIGQVAHFKIKKKISKNKIRDGLNKHLLPLPIAVMCAEVVKENFDARFSAKKRSYQYLIINRRSPLTIKKKQAWIIHKKLNIIKMKKAACIFEGKHDFNAYRSINCQSKSSIRTIKSCKIKHEDEKISINVSAKSFLHNQVRIIVGTLVDVGKGKKKISDIKKIFKSRDRSMAGVTAPAHGLYLKKINY